MNTNAILLLICSACAPVYASELVADHITNALDARRTFGIDQAQTDMEQTVVTKQKNPHNSVATTTTKPELESTPETSNTMSTGLIKECLGALLLPLVVFLYSSGVPQIRDILKKGDTQGYTFMPFLFLQVNAFIWTVYAFHFGFMNMLQPAIGNAWGLLVNTVYLIVYGANMKDPQIKSKFVKTVGILETVFIIIALVSWIPGAQSCQDPNAMYCWTGKLVVLVNCFLFTGAFDAFGSTWRTKSVEFFPILTPCLGFLASFDCIFYFALQNDINGLIPNLIGDCLNLSQVIFYLYVSTKYEQTWRTKNIDEKTGGGLGEKLIGSVSSGSQKLIGA